MAEYFFKQHPRIIRFELSVYQLSIMIKVIEVQGVSQLLLHMYTKI